MSDENTECKETILKFKESSLIQKLFDQFLIKENILRLANQSSFTFTEWFFDSVILFLFFLVIFYFADLMIWGINSATMVLMTIALVSIIEFIGANYSKVRRWLSSEEQTNKVLDNIVNIPSPELERKVDDLRFSSRCLNKLFSIISDDPNRIPPYIVERIVTNQALTQENLNKIFMPKTLLNVREEVIFNVIFRKRDKLTKQNIQNIFNSFSDNDRILKMLIATQKDSKEILEDRSQRDIYIQFYDKYQNRKEQIDFFMKINPVFFLREYGKYFSLIVGALLTIAFLYLGYLSETTTGISSTYSSLQYISIAFFAPWFLIGIFRMFISMPLLNFLWRNYYKRFKINVIN